MSYDGIVTASVVHELKSKLLNSRIDKIHQPERDEIIISLRSTNGNYKLLLSANSSNPRVHLTEVSKENPITAPLFCMLMRKHLASGKITNIVQQDFDRIIKFDIESYTELGDLTTKSLIVEIMGKHSNIILVNSDNKILDSIKHVDFTVSAVRQILPGLIYELPPRQDKISPSAANLEKITEIVSAFPNGSLLDKNLLSEFLGLSPLISREIVYRFCKDLHIFAENIDKTAFSKHVYEFFGNILNSNFEPSIVIDEKTKKPVAFSCVKLTQYEGSGIIECDSSISKIIEAFYITRANHDRMTQKSAHLVKLVNNNIERCEKKLKIHTENIEKAKNRDKYKIYGDLITANMYMLEYGMSEATVINYYSENSEEVTIPLKPELSPSKNAQRYYKMYNKQKTAEKYSLEQIEDAKNEKYYLETVLDSLSKAESQAEIFEIQDELAEQGYTAKITSKKKKFQKKSSPMQFISSDGYTILVGRNNKQNDELTIKTAYSTDIWLHTKVIPGSHTIIRTNGGEKIPDRTLLEAAELAAYFSKAKNSAQVPIDYTEVKNVKKPNGAKPGLVIYDYYNTVYVQPSEETVKRLAAE